MIHKITFGLLQRCWKSVLVTEKRTQILQGQFQVTFLIRLVMGSQQPGVPDRKWFHTVFMVILIKIRKLGENISIRSVQGQTKSNLCIQVIVLFTMIRCLCYKTSCSFRASKRYLDCCIGWITLFSHFGTICILKQIRAFKNNDCNSFKWWNIFKIKVL